MTLSEKYNYIDGLVKQALDSQDESIIAQCLRRLSDCYEYHDERIQTPADRKLEEHLDDAHDKVESYLYTVEENNGNFGFNDG
jgi:hypothetical protein